MTPSTEHAPQRLVIVGTGGHAREVHELIEDINEAAHVPAWDVLGWLDSNAATHGKRVHDLPVLGDIDWLASQEDTWVTVAIGATHVRRRVTQRLQAQGQRLFATLIHPTAVVGRRARIGAGSVLCAGSMATTDCRIGEHALLNRLAMVAHDDVLGDFVTLAPGVVLSGSVTVGEGTDIGTTAAVNQGLSIGEWSIVGSGAVVIKSLPDNCTAVGAPAKPIKERPAGWHL